MDPWKRPPAALLIHRVQRHRECGPHQPGRYVPQNLPDPLGQGVYDSFDGVTQQVDQTDAQAGLLQKIDGCSEIVVVFLFHSSPC